MPEIFKTQRRVEFRDTDTAGIVHFSNFFVYMEQAEHELLRSLGLTVLDYQADGQKYSFPRVSARCDYRVAIRFEDVIDVHVAVLKIGTSSITYGFKFYREETLIAEGSITVVCCEFEHGKKPKSVPTPEAYKEALRTFLVDQ